MAETPFTERLIVEVAEPFRVMDQVDPHVSEAFQTLYDQTMRALQFDERAKQAFVKVEQMELPKQAFRIGAPTPPGRSEEIVGDDRLTLLLVDDKLVGLVLERRDDANWTEVSSASFLTAELAEELRTGTTGAFGQSVDPD